MSLDIQIDNHQDDGLGFVATAAFTGISLLGGFLGGGNKKRIAKYQANYQRTAADLNKKFGLKQNSVKRIDERIKKAKAEISRLEIENNTIVETTAKRVESKKVEINKKSTQTKTRNIAIGVVALAVISAVIYKKKAK